MKEEKNDDWTYFGSAKYQFIDAIMKESGVPNSMFDDAVEDWHDKQVHVGTARLATTSTENRNMMLLLC
jgi:hypothetical protein